MRQAKDIPGKIHVAKYTGVTGIIHVVFLLFCCAALVWCGDTAGKPPWFSFAASGNADNTYSPAFDYTSPGAMAGLACIIRLRTSGIKQALSRYHRALSWGVSLATAFLYLLFCAMWRFLSHYYINTGLKKKTPLAINLGGHAPPFG